MAQAYAKVDLTHQPVEGGADLWPAEPGERIQFAKGALIGEWTHTVGLSLLIKHSDGTSYLAIYDTVTLKDDKGREVHPYLEV